MHLPGAVSKTRSPRVFPQISQQCLAECFHKRFVHQTCLDSRLSWQRLSQECLSNMSWQGVSQEHLSRLFTKCFASVLTQYLLRVCWRWHSQLPLVTSGLRVLSGWFSQPGIKPLGTWWTWELWFFLFVPVTLSNRPSVALNCLHVLCYAIAEFEATRSYLPSGWAFLTSWTWCFSLRENNLRNHNIC